jgi:zinc transport system permease protein
VLFVTSLALGAILIPETELLEAFFGGLEKLSFFQILFQTLVSFVVIIVILGQIKKLTLVSIAPELATASRVSERKIELLLLVLMALTIAIGISFVGVLLISALSIVPAATARNFAKNFKSFLLFSVLLAVAALAIGIALAPLLRIGTGVLTVLASAFFFSLSLLRKK